MLPKYFLSDSHTMCFPITSLKPFVSAWRTSFAIFGKAGWVNLFKKSIYAFISRLLCPVKYIGLAIFGWFLFCLFWEGVSIFAKVSLLAFGIWHSVASWQLIFGMRDLNALGCVRIFFLCLLPRFYVCFGELSLTESFVFPVLSIVSLNKLCPFVFLFLDSCDTTL